MEDSVRALIADDHPLFREGMRGRLDRVADIAVVGEAASGDEAVELAHNLRYAIRRNRREPAVPDDWWRRRVQRLADLPLVRSTSHALGAEVSQHGYSIKVDGGRPRTE
jgi:hypothetical protein